MSYLIKTENFEGPFDLLLELIGKKKLEINEISLAQIATQYLEHIKATENFSAEETASFIAVASTLMLIKSQSLIPNLEITDEEEESMDELERRLNIYKFIKENLATELKSRFGRTPLFARESFKGVDVGFIEPLNVSAESLADALKNFLNSIPKKEDLPQVKVRKMIKLEEKMEELMMKIQKNLEFSFNDFAVSIRGGASMTPEEIKEKKVEIVVSFLAVLELIRQGIVMARQENLFEGINIKSVENV
ncbi:TPA: hypothetical protein DEW47_00900 [Patescibacteria group bacterium]|nr:MAG: Segregation and condensation protein A [Parcubacteria group bacterium GW2011_GWF2_40_10]KKR47651.1 MAG: Segregation and condensation protein A [Parcubacteria group bacterium GW2011_GWA2_40_143]KKR60016.1 MAG: Segregation and condensation protein A [Parcubacteria group bacterium GW2011_GWC2_40_31]KKR75550.1 MAG: Segregation and condensation protein A [Parcubacteria group bacterium GW2011_GWB2_40_8]KKR77646.1 MAG: Segregation and condensation protein A [Parcubacteria group bacterium GW201